MGERTGIAWCDHTFNPWMGCTKVSPGCEHCYAERDMAIRHKLVEWGPGAPRRRTTEANWKKVYGWDRKAAAEGVQRRVFCASLADIFDNEVPNVWRDDLWDVVRRTPNLDWLLLTKRIGNARTMLPEEIERLPNVWLGITVVNQEEADRDLPKLMQFKTRVRWLSMEPLLEAVNLYRAHRPPAFGPAVDWVVVGGESGHHARPMHETWAADLMHQCRAAGVAFFMKQLSEASSPAFKDFESFPKHLKVREFPR